MILRIKLTYSDDKGFFRIFEIHSEKTFLAFHHAIQQEMGYEKGNMASFFLCDREWDRKEEITLMDMGNDLVIKMPIHKMEDVVLDEFMDEEGQRMSYLFDFFSDRSFQLEVIESLDINETEPLICIQRQGTPPPQNLMVDEFGDIVHDKKKSLNRNQSEINTLSLDEQDDFFEESDEFNNLSDIENLDKLPGEEDDDDLF